MKVLSNEHGVGLVAILLALLVAAALYLGYFRFQGAMNERASGQNALDASRSVACRTNRQMIERDLVMWSVDHPDRPPTLADLAASGIRVPSCPEGGRYDLVGREVRCSKHP